MLSKKRILIFLLSGLIFSCALQEGTSISGVEIIANPYGEGDDVKPREGEFIIFTNGGSFNCRPSTSDINTIKPFLQKNGLLNEANQGLLDILGLETETSEEEGASASGISIEEDTKKEPVKVEVEDGWLKVGFRIKNGSDYHLVITDIIFKAEGRYRGQIFPHQKNISTDYCDSPFANALYFVPKGNSAKKEASVVEYKPNSKDMLINLTIYVDGFPFINRITGEGANTAPTVQAGGTAGPGGLLAVDPDIARGCYTSVPRYRVEVLFAGYFVTNRGSRLNSFGYRLSFFTKSFHNC